jgi:hypothetical protein
MLPQLAVCRDKLVVRFILRRRVVLPVVPTHAVPQMVRKVQLHSWRWCVRFYIDVEYRATLLTCSHAALDGGTQFMVFILSFAVQGAAGTSHLFPQWWGANQGGNYDRCAVAS